MSTSGAAKPSCWKGKGSNERPSSTGVCNIATPLPNIINQVSQSLRYFRPHPVSNHLTTDTLGCNNIRAVTPNGVGPWKPFHISLDRIALGFQLAGLRSNSTMVLRLRHSNSSHFNFRLADHRSRNDRLRLLCAAQLRNLLHDPRLTILCCALGVPFAFVGFGRDRTRRYGMQPQRGDLHAQ